MKRAIGRLLCRLGLHAPAGAFGLVGPCSRAGCEHVTHHALLHGGGWIKHTVPPDSAQRPRGPPRPPGLPPAPSYRGPRRP